MTNWTPLLLIGGIAAAFYWESTREDRELRDRMMERIRRIDSLMERFEGVIPPEVLEALDRELGLGPAELPGQPAG